MASSSSSKRSRSLLPTLSPGASREERKRLKRTKEHEEDIKKHASEFKVSVKDINAMIEEGDTERAVGYFQKRLLATIVAMIPIAERQYRKYRTQSLAYAMTSLTGTARELAQDLQATADRQKLAMTIAHEILMPGFRAIAQSILDEHYSLKRDLEDDLHPKRVRRGKEKIDNTGRRIASHAEKVYRNVAERIHEALVR
jgi:hypothetical protein